MQKPPLTQKEIEEATRYVVNIHVECVASTGDGRLVSEIARYVVTEKILAVALNKGIKLLELTGE